MVLTHAHLDHSGYLPALVKAGFAGPIYCTDATRDLCEILLRDAGHLQEEEAEYANRKGFSRHRPALPLYTEADAVLALKRLVPVPFDDRAEVLPGVGARLRRAGHILGAATVTLEAEGRKLAFTGDLGRPDDPLLLPPEPIPHADALVCESTYGDRRHAPGDPGAVIGEVIRRTYARGGTLVIPAFAVGRTQLILYYLHRLRQTRAIPDLPIFLDSPMATDVTDLFARYGARHRLSGAEVAAVCRTAEVVNGAESVPGRRSGPAAQGHPLGERHGHRRPGGPPPQGLRARIPGAPCSSWATRPGAPGAPTSSTGPGRCASTGTDVPIAAEVVQLHEMSAHADADEIVGWMKGFETPPETTWLVHGEPEATEALRRRIVRELGWHVDVPEQLQRVAV